MEPHDGPSVLARLERAELAARERLLSAAVEADRVLAEARARTAEIDAETPGRARAAVTQLRARLLAEANAEVARIEAGGRAGASPGSDPAADPVADDQMRRAVEAVVAAVLGEPAPRVPATPDPTHRPLEPPRCS